MAELERVEMDPVPHDVEWEYLISSWTVCAQNILLEEFRRAMLLFTAHKRWGRSGLLEFCREVGCEKSSAYNRLRLWRTYGEAIENGDPEMSTRLENYGLDVSHWIASTYDYEPVEVLDGAEDAALPVRAMTRWIQERGEIRQIQEAQAAGKSVEVVPGPAFHDEDAPGREAGVEVMKGAILCPHCKGLIEGVGYLGEGGKR